MRYLDNPVGYTDWTPEEKANWQFDKARLDIKDDFWSIIRGGFHAWFVCAGVMATIAAVLWLTK